MTAVKPSDFAEFFHALHGYEPFPWQARVAKRVCGTADSPGHWPRCIALPTAAGKTACIDIAVFALACQASRAPQKRTAPCRVFFVVDRRLVVDQAYEHSKKVAEKLGNASGGVLERAADALKRLAGCECDSTCDCRPLDVYALRGGMYRDSAWVRSPLQPTVITSTVDQVGSRLLFRGYGVSDATKPLHAALVANDSLILLDEAHCAKPFDQTMTLVKKYREWAQDRHALPLPLHFVTMTATPSGSVAEAHIERLNEEDREHTVLGKRIAARKPTRLVIAQRAKGAKKWRDELVTELVKQAKQAQRADVRAVGVIVNRVATARDVAARLRSDVGGAAEILLLTGRMRPVDRDVVMKRIEPLLSSSSTPLERPTFVVATQTIEVGADLDFHALVTECASLDALRQRFGRLNRIAARDNAGAVIVVRADQAEPANDDADADPVYGHSLANTWKWLWMQAEDMPDTQAEIPGSSNGQEDSTRDKRNKKTRGAAASAPSAAKVVDFGVAGMDKRLADPKTRPENPASLNAPSVDAAVLLPAHLDMWCQTSPRPVPDPDPSSFLHGPQRGEPEVQVVFRADLGDDTDKWAEIVSHCPPSSSEALSVRLGEFRRWLAGMGPDDRASDVEGEHIADEVDNTPDEPPTTRHVLRWRGPDSAETVVVDELAAATPNDTYLVPIANDGQRRAAALLGDFPTGADGTLQITDAGDEAFQKSRDKALLRLRHALYPALDPSIDAVDPDAIDDDETAAKIDAALDALTDYLRSHPNESLARAVESLRSPRLRSIARHPLGGIVLLGKSRLHQFDPTFVEPDDSGESSSDRPYPLDQHCRDVASLAKTHARRCGLDAHSSIFELAGLLHDAGKADMRFQAWLHGGNSQRAMMCGTLYAKSNGLVQAGRKWSESRNRAGYPEGGRHELASVRLAECDGALPSELNAAQRDLLLHLIAAHHGYCRPFAPVIEDPHPQEIVFKGNGRTLRACSATALERLDSGVAERFWMLTRRYGWWGLPYLEALLRLADWACGEPREPADAMSRNASSNGAAAATQAALPEVVP